MKKDTEEPGGNSHVLPTSIGTPPLEETEEEYVKRRILKYIDNVLCLDDIQGVVSLHQLGLLPRDEMKGYFNQRHGPNPISSKNYWQHIRKDINFDQMKEALLFSGSCFRSGDPRRGSPLLQENSSSVRTPVHYKSKHIDVNARNSDGETALTFALKNEQLEMIKILIEKGNADVDAQNDEGFTELMMAARRGQANMVKLLVNRYHANPHIRNKDGMTATMIAEKFQRSDIVRFLSNIP